MAVVLNLLLAVNLLHITWAWVLDNGNNTSNPEHARNSSRADAGTNQTLTKKAYIKFHEINDNMRPIVTLANIKLKLKESGVFDQDKVTLTEREQKELKKLFEAIEIMMTSRARQPSNVQTTFSSLRLVERVIQKQRKEGQLSGNLAAKFHWEKLPSTLRRPRERLIYRLNKNKTMRIFDLQ